MKSVQEKCGLFGLYSSADCVHEIYQGMDCRKNWRRLSQVQ